MTGMMTDLIGLNFKKNNDASEGYFLLFSSIPNGEQKMKKYSGV